MDPRPPHLEVWLTGNNTCILYNMAVGGSVRCFDRVKYGFMMGAAIGTSIGALYGGVAGLRFGLRGRELFSQLGKAVIQTGGTFGGFMAVGSAIRC